MSEHDQELIPYPALDWKPDGDGGWVAYPLEKPSVRANVWPLASTLYEHPIRWAVELGTPGREMERISEDVATIEIGKEAAARAVETMIWALAGRAQAALVALRHPSVDAPPSPPTEPLYYLLSIQHTIRQQGVLNWEGHGMSGYTYRLELAGRFTEAEIAAHPRHDDGIGSRAVPVAVVEALWRRADEVRGEGMDWWRDGHQHVIDFKHLKALRKPHLLLAGGAR